MALVDGFRPMALPTSFFFNVLLLLLLLSFHLSTISADIHGRISGWQIVTKHNSSHEIRQADIILMITFPWSGDARSLSEELTRFVTMRREEFGSIRIKLTYMNNGNITKVADPTGEVFYQHYFSYSYQTRLQASDVLLSARYLLSLPPVEHKAKSPSTRKEVLKFAEYDDGKDVILVEGWTFRNLINSNNGAGSSIGLTSWTSVEGKHRQYPKTTGRMLLQANKGCPVNMEGLNYTVVTTKCKGPEYKSNVCCTAFKELACPLAGYINDVTTECATILFSYLNLRGNYPPGLFANQCVEPSKQGLFCGIISSDGTSSSHHTTFYYCLLILSLFFIW